MMFQPLSEMGGLANQGGLAASMVNILDEKTMKLIKTSLVVNKLFFVSVRVGVAADTSQVVKPT